MKRLLIQNAHIVDGTGGPAQHGDVLVEGDSIAEVGETSLPPDEVLDIRGLVLAPGFIDIHSHSDFTLASEPDAAPKTKQGVSTEVVGNCGLGILPADKKVGEFYARYGSLFFGEQGGDVFPDLPAFRKALDTAGVAVNVACLVPHGNLRCAAMGMAERAPSAAELDHMRQWLERELEHGAFGMSTGLVYPPGAYAQTDEIIDLAHTVKKMGGFYATHIRNEAGRLVPSIAEALQIGEAASVPVQISHHKAAGRFNWGKVAITLRMVDLARQRGLNVHSDMYPYTAGSTVLSALFVPLWAFEGSHEDLLRRLSDPETRAKMRADSEEAVLRFAQLPGILDHILPKRRLLPVFMREIARAIIVSSVKTHHEVEGKSLLQLSKERRTGIWDTIWDLLLEEDLAVVAMVHLMSEQDIRTVMRHHATMFGTDGLSTTEGKPHPRTYGTYPRVLQHYVREERVLELETAVYKMTGMVATKLGLTDRGRIRPGHKADLVVFDPEQVFDRATYDAPKQSPFGIHHLFVNGVWTVKDGALTGDRGGRLLRHRAR